RRPPAPAPADEHTRTSFDASPLLGLVRVAPTAKRSGSWCRLATRLREGGREAHPVRPAHLAAVLRPRRTLLGVNAHKAYAPCTTARRPPDPDVNRMIRRLSVIKHVDAKAAA